MGLQLVPRPGNGATAFAVYSTKRLNENLREIHAEVRENVARPYIAMSGIILTTRYT